MAGVDKTIKVTSVDENTWSPPDKPSKVYWTIGIDGFSAEPVKWVQDKERNSPAPVVGESQEGKVYKGDKGYTFYPTTPRKSYGGGKNNYNDPDKQNQIKAQWAIGQAVQILKPSSPESVLNLDHLETMAKSLFNMVDRVKGSVVTDTKKQDWVKPETRERLKQAKEVADEARVQNALSPEEESLLDSEEPINLDDIPF